MMLGVTLDWRVNKEGPYELDDGAGDLGTGLVFIVGLSVGSAVSSEVGSAVGSSVGSAV